MLRILDDIVFALECSCMINSSIGTCVRKLKLTSILFGVWGEVRFITRESMFGEGDCESIRPGEYFIVAFPLRCSLIFLRLSCCFMTELVFTSVRKLLPRRSSLGYLPRGVYIAVAAKTFFWEVPTILICEGLYKFDFLLWDRDICF